MYIKNLDHSETNGNPKTKYDRAYTDGREPISAETKEFFTLAFLLARGKNAKMLDQTLGP